MVLSLMSEEDLTCLHEFIAAGNGEAMYEYAVDNEYVFDSARDYIAMLEKSVEAGCPLAAEELACIFQTGKSDSFIEKEFAFPVDEEKAQTFKRLATILEEQREKASIGRVLFCDFFGWMQLRFGELKFDASYIFPSFPRSLLDMCIARADDGKLMSEWFSDEEHRYDICEEVVDGVPHLFIHWKDDDNEDHCAQFPDYDFISFATHIADDIESNYFGCAYFMTCEGMGLHNAAKDLKQRVAVLRLLLKSGDSAITAVSKGTSCEPNI